MWIVNAGRPLQVSIGFLALVMEKTTELTHMDAMLWKVARCVAASPNRTGSEKLAASSGVGPFLLAL